MAHVEVTEIEVTEIYVTELRLESDRQSPRPRSLVASIEAWLGFLVEIPALVMLGIWIFLQFLPAVGQLASPDVGSQGGVAYFAHIGGFLFGLLLNPITLRHRSSRHAITIWSTCFCILP